MPSLKEKEYEPSMSGGGKKPPRKTKIGTGGGGDRPRDVGKGPNKDWTMPTGSRSDEKKKKNLKEIQSNQDLAKSEGYKDKHKNPNKPSQFPKDKKNIKRNK